jgi:hypothetical protein
MSLNEKLTHWSTAKDTAHRDLGQDTDDVIIPPRYQEVRPFLLTNPAYKILIQRARSAAPLTDRRQAAIESIAHVISAAFMSLRANSDATYRAREVRVSLN